MVEGLARPKHNLRVLSVEQFEAAKRYWTWSLLLKLGVFLVGVVVLWIQSPQQSTTQLSVAQYTPYVVAILSVASEVCMMNSDRLKGVAEVLKRKLDLEDAWGWAISRIEVSDLLAHSPSGLRSKLTVDGPCEPYFQSPEGIGVGRALENVQESAWWSKHLASRMSVICLVATGVWIAVGLVSVLISIETIRNFDTLSAIGRIVTSAIVLAFSLGLIRLTIGYYCFSAKAAAAEKLAVELSCSQATKPAQAIKAYYEYALARATAPLLPTWLYKMMQQGLNDLWREYRQSPTNG